MTTTRQPFLLRALLKREWVPSFDRYPFNLAAVRSLDEIAFHPAVTFLVGENGSGKSTLLEAIAVALGLNAEGGSNHFGFSTRSSHSDLFRFLKPVRGARVPLTKFFLRAESFYNLATDIEALDGQPGSGRRIIESYGGRSLHDMSHGESFFAVVMNRFGDNGLYILDEPEAALSPSRQMALMIRMRDLVEAGSQFIIATHSPILMAYPDAAILELDERGVQARAFEETEHYRVTRRFLLDRSRALRALGIEVPDDPLPQHLNPPAG